MFPKGCKNRCDLVQELPKESTNRSSTRFIFRSGHDFATFLLQKMGFLLEQITTRMCQREEWTDQKIGVTPMISWSVVTSSTVIEYVPIRFLADSHISMPGSSWICWGCVLLEHVPTSALVFLGLFLGTLRFLSKSKYPSDHNDNTPNPLNLT